MQARVMGSKGKLFSVLVVSGKSRKTNKSTLEVIGHLLLQMTAIVLFV